MTTNRLPGMVLLVAGILLLAKAIWAAARPQSARRLATWWSGAATRVNTLTGCIYTLAAVSLWVLVLLHQPLTNWVLTGLGAIFAWWAALYFKPPAFQKALDTLIVNRTPGSVRALAILLAVLALLFIGIALRELR
ncbi:MAG: hypothetical protein K8T26_13015 [Lentisphaerae bacterium]|nr:hypothetical protein [Lentisphaerota bacterium]